jgi:branched-chain amino acid transport system substrate-binding protein
MRKSSRIMLGCLAALSLLGCGILNAVAQDKAAGDKAKTDGGTIKIGALFAVTGPAANLGGPEAKTAEMLVEKINAAGGVQGRKIELIIKDTGGNPEKAVSFAKQLIEEQKVLAIIGPSTSGETMQIKPICEERKTILISCAAAEVIANPVAKYVFKTAPKDNHAVTWIYNTMKEMGITKIGIISGNDGFGAAGKKQLEDLAKTAGMEILVDEVYAKDATDLTDILTKVKAAKVQAIVNWSIVPAQSMVAKNMKQLGLDVPLFQSHGFANRKYLEAAGKAAEGTLFPAGRLLVVDELAADNPQKTVLADYKKDYEAKYKDDVSTFGGHAYDAITIIVEAIKKAGSADSEKVRDAIENLKGFVGTAGIFNFSPEDHTGLDLNAFEMLVVKDGKFTIYKKK